MPFKTLISALLIGASLLTQTASANGLQLVNPPTPMPAFKIPGINGSSGSDADLRNKVTVIRFWASW